VYETSFSTKIYFDFSYLWIDLNLRILGSVLHTDHVDHHPPCDREMNTVML